MNVAWMMMMITIFVSLEKTLLVRPWSRWAAALLLLIVGLAEIRQ
jgi:putative Mn2+ efflux pump MntP